MFVLLCEPDLLTAPYREIVKAADVALGAIGPVFDDLKTRGYIAGEGDKRRLLEPVRLFEEWVTNYPIKLRPKLNPRRFRAQNPQWWRDADLTGLGAYWGAEIAAERLTKYLHPAMCTLYIEPEAQAMTELVKRYRLHADGTGNIEILEAFWRLPVKTEPAEVVPPILAYADLVATLDPRNLEVAKMIRNQYIDNALNTR
jgi:hypothetical protein